MYFVCFLFFSGRPYQDSQKGPLKVILNVPRDMQAMKLPWLLSWWECGPSLIMLSSGLECCKVRAGVNSVHKRVVDQRAPCDVQLIVLYF